jgi:hypothetical protein
MWCQLISRNFKYLGTDCRSSSSQYSRIILTCVVFLSVRQPSNVGRTLVFYFLDIIICYLILRALAEKKSH